MSKCLDAGLSEITFSLHGPNAKVHDALVGVKGAFEQEVAGLKAALADGRPIVNIDIVINRGNVKHLPTMLKMFSEMGVREFDLLQVIPFGRAFTEGRESLFYDLEEMRPYLLEAFAYSKQPDMHIWLNRFPPQHLEGYEHLIQDPYKLNDEVRGRKEEYVRLLDEGTPLDCRDPARCRYCYLERLCDTLDDVRETVATGQFDAVRIDTEWESQQLPVFGGDPASARRAKAEAARLNGKVALPMYGGAPVQAVPTLSELVTTAGTPRLWICAPSVARAREELARWPGGNDVELELNDYGGLAEFVAPSSVLDGHTIVRARTASRSTAEQLLAMPAAFEVCVALSRDTADWALTLDPVPPRLALYQPTYERLTESASNDVDLRAFFRKFTANVRVDGVPACVTGQRAPEREPQVLDSTMLSADGRIEIFRYTKRYIMSAYRTKSLRCKNCAYNAQCDGMHVNYVRAHGYGIMQPVMADAG